MKEFITIEQKVELLKLASKFGSGNGEVNTAQDTIKNYDLLIAALTK